MGTPYLGGTVLFALVLAFFAILGTVYALMPSTTSTRPETPTPAARAVARSSWMLGGHG